MAWNAERIAELKDLWAKGYSASQIAKEMGGGLTRNSIIGKVSRLGLAGRMSRSNVTSLPKQQEAAMPANEEQEGRREQQRARRITAAQEDAALDTLAGGETDGVNTADRPLPGRGVTFEQWDPSTCSYPHGDPKQPGFLFCGAPLWEHSSNYCRTHHKRCHTVKKTAESALDQPPA